MSKQQQQQQGGNIQPPSSPYYQQQKSPGTYSQVGLPPPIDPAMYAAYYAQYQQATGQEAYTQGSPSSTGPTPYVYPPPPEAYNQAYDGATTYYLPQGYAAYTTQPHPRTDYYTTQVPQYTHQPTHHHSPYPSPYPGYGGSYSGSGGSSHHHHHHRPRPAYGATFGHIDPKTGHDYRRLDDGGKYIDTHRVHDILAKRLRLKMNRGLIEADRLRDELTSMGVMVHDREKTWEVRRTPCTTSFTGGSQPSSTVGTNTIEQSSAPRPSTIINTDSTTTGPSNTESHHSPKTQRLGGQSHLTSTTQPAPTPSEISSSAQQDTVQTATLPKKFGRPGGSTTNNNYVSSSPESSTVPDNTVDTPSSHIEVTASITQQRSTTS